MVCWLYPSCRHTRAYLQLLVNGAPLGAGGGEAGAKGASVTVVGQAVIAGGRTGRGVVAEHPGEPGLGKRENGETRSAFRRTSSVALVSEETSVAEAG